MTKRGDSRTPVSPSMEQGRLEKVLPRGPTFPSSPMEAWGPWNVNGVSRQGRSGFSPPPASLPSRFLEEPEAQGQEDRKLL